MGGKYSDPKPFVSITYSLGTDKDLTFTITTIFIIINNVIINICIFFIFIIFINFTLHFFLLFFVDSFLDCFCHLSSRICFLSIKQDKKNSAVKFEVLLISTHVPL